MIYDCFLFNNELDLLELRLEYMNPHVDKFVIVESRQTLSGMAKDKYFHDNITRFEKFKSKIIYLECPLRPDLLDPWDYEYYQRNYIKTALKNCLPDDTVIISDVDELIDIRYILDNYDISIPSLIEIDMFYYYLNLTSNNKWTKVLVTYFKSINDFNIGNRETYTSLFPQIISCNNKKIGWHFSYLYGENINLYQKKIQSFSHLEYNTPYYLNEDRIRNCVRLGIDLFERKEILYSFKRPTYIFSIELFNAIKRTNLTGFLGKPFSILMFLVKPKLFKFYFKLKGFDLFKKKLSRAKSKLTFWKV